MEPRNKGTCEIIENLAESLVDLALELRYQMIEEGNESKEDQIQFLKEAIDQAHSQGEYKDIMAAAALLEEVSINNQ